MIRGMKAMPPRPVVFLAFAVLTGLLAFAPIANNDIWLHLKTGSLILDQARVPQVDAYTFTRAGAPYIAHEWLSQALFAFLHRHLGGLSALSMLYAALVGAVLWVSHANTARRLRAEPGFDPDVARAAAVLATAALFYLMPSALALRPHLFTFLMAALFAAILPGADSAAPRRRRAALISLPALQILWANLHGGFVVGILLSLIRLVSAGLRRPRARVLLAAAALPPALAAASCLNPYGPRLYALVWKFSDPVFRRAIVEWKSPFDGRFAASPIFWCYLVWLAAAAIVAVRLALRRGKTAPALTVLAFGAMSALSRRHISLLAILTAPLFGLAVADALASLARRRRAAVVAASWGGPALVLALAALAARGLLAGSAATPRPGLIARNIPVEALEVMRGQGLSGRVFTTVGMGSYVTWRGWPALTTSIDSRLEVFGGGFLAEHLAAARDAERFGSFAEAHPFDFALLPWRLATVRGALTSLDGDPGWALIYFDDVAALYARRLPGTEAVVAQRAYRYLRPTGFLRGGSFGVEGDLREVVREARRASEDPPRLPGRPPVNRTALTLLRALGG
jgi:hypothetical protein